MKEDKILVNKDELLALLYRASTVTRCGSLVLEEYSNGHGNKELASSYVELLQDVGQKLFEMAKGLE